MFLPAIITLVILVFPVPGLADVSALGRVEPHNGVFNITAPIIAEAGNGAILKSLHVSSGDAVEKGQLLAVMESDNVLRALRNEAAAAHQSALKDAMASVAVAEAECTRAGVTKREADRRQSLLKQKLSSEEESERSSADAIYQMANCHASEMNAEAMISRADLAAEKLISRESLLARASVFSPVRGRVLNILKWPGESIDAEGILELGATDNMYAIAEVYETDIYKVKVGQSASISSPAISGELHGKVEYIRPMIRKQDVTGTDPAARKDARVVEVEIKLGDVAKISQLTNLQVEIIIEE